MGKSVYSLVLDDDLIKLVDAQANKSAKSRSSVINDLIAMQLRVNTPEMQSRELVVKMNEVLSQSDKFGILVQDTSMLLRSALTYKYNPTVKYTLDVANDKGIYGILKVTVRSKSTAFLEVFDTFISTWNNTEAKYNPNIEKEYESGKYKRILRISGNDSQIDAASCFSSYITEFDSAMKLYFDMTANLTSDAADVELVRRYDEFMKRPGAIIM